MSKRKTSSHASMAFSIFLFIIFMPLSANAGTVRLTDLIAEARGNNPALKAYGEKIKGAEARAKAEGVLDDPTLKVEMEDLSTDHPLNVSPGSAMLTRYTFSQMFPFPGKLSLKEKIAYKEALSARSELRAKELDILTDLKKAYFDYAYLADAVKKTSEIKETLLYMSRIAGTKYATGQVSQQDAIKVNVEITMLENDLIMLGAEKEMAGARIRSLVSRPQTDQLGEPEELSGKRVDVNTAALIDAAVANNPEVKMLEFESEAMELSTDLMKKDYWPDFMLGIAPIQREGSVDAFDVMFQINIPIWRSKYSSRVAEASSIASYLRSKLVNEKNMKALEVKEAALKVETADRLRTLYETSLLPQVELSFASALKNYQTGKIDFLMLLDTERELKRIRIEHLKTILEYRKAVAALEKTVGQDL